MLDTSVIVLPGATLTIDPGVNVQLADTMDVVIHGALSCIGTAESMIVFEPAAGAEYWGSIGFIRADSSSVKYTHLRRTKRSIYDSTGTVLPGAITSYETYIEVSDCEFVDGDHGAQAVSMRYLTTGHIKRNSFIGFRNQIISGIDSNCHIEANYIDGSAGDDDSIEYGDTLGGISYINYNYIYYPGDDGIDADHFLGSMTGNVVIHADDKGISVSSTSAGRLDNNLVVESYKGMGITAGSLIGMWNNTITGCLIAMTVEEQNPGFGGATVYGANNNIWGNLNDIQIGPLSSVDFTYSNIQGDMPGQGNINVDPLFVYPDSLDYRLAPGSPCIDAGLSTNAPLEDFEMDPRFDDPETPNTGCCGDLDYYDIGYDEYYIPSASIASEPATAPTPPTIVRVRPNPLVAGEPFLVQAHLRQRGELRLIDVQGRVRRVWSTVDVPGVIMWSGRDEHGQRLAAGVYFLEFRALGASGPEPGWTSRFTLVR